MSAPILSDSWFVSIWDSWFRSSDDQVFVKNPDGSYTQTDYGTVGKDQTYVNPDYLIIPDKSNPPFLSDSWFGNLFGGIGSSIGGIIPQWLKTAFWIAVAVVGVLVFFKAYGFIKSILNIFKKD